MAESQSPQTNKDRLKEITASIETGIKELFESDKYRQYLTTMSRFHKYSVNNTMLIYLRKPDATVVAGFNKWKDQFGRNVKKGERGIKIIAPTPYKKMIEQDKLDPDTKLPMRDTDGKIITEEKEIRIPMYKPVTVFDLSQTEGKPLPQLASDLQGNVQNYDVFMEALKRSAPVPIEIIPLAKNLDGYFDSEHQRIAIREGMSEVQTVSATIHEIAHSKLHNKELPEVVEQWKLVMVSDGGTRRDFTGGYDTQVEAEAAAEDIDWKVIDENEFEWRLEVDEDTSIAEYVRKSKNLEEVQAESVSFAVSAYYGIATGENSFGYIASWSKDKELSELRESLETINKTASSLITDIDRNYAEIMKERGLDKVKLEQASSPFYEYKIHANPRGTSEKDGAFIQVYEHKAGEVYASDIIGFGAYSDFIPLVNRLNDDKVTPAVAMQITGEYAYTPPSPEVERGVEETPAVTAPDNGYLPDPSMSIEAMNAYGYTDEDMLPLSRERAIELFERDIPVYMLYADNTEAMTFDTDEIITFDGILGVTVADWELAPDDLKPKDIEQAFLSNPADAFAIYQLRNADDTAELRFMATDYLQRKGLEIDRDNYIPVYTGALDNNGDEQDKLNSIYAKFNIDRPQDFTGHSLSVSDIVVLRQNGVVSCHYVDSWGFKEVPAFLPQQNYLKNAEMAVEDDYNQIDGIINNGKRETTAELEEKVKAGQPISLLSYVEAARCESEPQEAPKQPEKKPSVLAKLHIPSTENTMKSAPRKSAERELL
jgi:uncharacterized protein YciU (UPF0263 family)